MIATWFTKITKHKWTKRILVVAVIYVLLFVVPFRSDGPYQGRVVDKYTGEPISGAVVVGYWKTMSVNVGGGTSKCVDAKETVTDENGDFELSGIRGSILGSIGTMNIVLYKVGSEPIWCEWESLDLEGGCFPGVVEWEGDRAVIPLKPLPKSKAKLQHEGRPPLITCGRKDGKILEAWARVNAEFDKALDLKR